MKKKRNTKFSLSLFDSLIVIVCTIGIAVSVGFFIKDMNISLVSDEQVPIGVVYYKKNTAQRRLINRNLWERVKDSMPVYNGDRIRTGNVSEACLVLENGTEINLYENTLVQIFNDGKSSINFVNGSMAVVAGDSEDGSGETIVVKTGNKILSLTDNTSALISKEVSKNQEEENDTVIAVSSGEIHVKALDERKAAKGNNTAIYETIEAGSVAEVASEQKIEKTPVEEKTENNPPVKQKKDDFKVVMPGQSYTVTQNKDEIKFVPFFWTEEKDVRVEFSDTADFNKIVNTEYLSSETHKGSVSLDFAKNGQILYWRVIPAKEKLDSQKSYPKGKIIVRSDETKQKELKEAVAVVFGEESAEKISEQVLENTKAVEKNEEIAMSEIKPAVTSKTNPQTFEKKPVQTIENYIQERIDLGIIKPVVKENVEVANKIEEKPAKTESLSIEKKSEENTTSVSENKTVEKTESNLETEKVTVPKEETVKPVFPIIKKPKKPVTTKPKTPVTKTESKPEVLPEVEKPVVEEKNETPAEVQPEIKDETIKENEPAVEENIEIKETPAEKTEVHPENEVVDSVIPENPEKPEEKDLTETEEEKTEVEEIVPKIPSLVEMEPELQNPFAGRKFTEADFELMDDPYIEFTWKSIEGAQAYKFVIKDESGTVIWTTTVRTNKYILMDRIDLISEDGVYIWEITAVTKEDEEVYTSKTASRSFRIEMDSPENVTNISGEKLITIE